VKARVADESGEITAVWFNQAWLKDRLQPGTRVRLRGNLKGSEFTVRSYDVNGVAATADFAPVYPASEEITVKKLRDVVGKALDYAGDVVDPLPAVLKAREGLPGRSDALVALHRPASEEQGEQARKRLAFDELLALQVGLARRREGRDEERAPALGEPGELLLVEEAVGHVELGLDVRLVPVRAHRRRIRTGAEEQPDRLSEDRLARTRLARDGVQPRREREVRLADEDEVLDAEPTKQRCRGSG
jgi:hypothetical protein